MPLTNWQDMFNSVKGIFNKLPTPVNGKIPVGVDSLNVTLSSNSLTIANDANNPIPVTGNISTGLSQPLTDTQLRASAVPVSLSSLPAFASTPTFNIGTAPNLTITNTSFTANAGTNLNTSLLALESGGNLASINAKLPSNLTVTSTRLLVDGSGTGKIKIEHINS